MVSAQSGVELLAVEVLNLWVSVSSIVGEVKEHRETILVLGVVPVNGAGAWHLNSLVDFV